MRRMIARTGRVATFLSDIGHNPFKLLMVMLAGLFLTVDLVRCCSHDHDPTTTTRHWYTWRDVLVLSVLLALIGSTHWFTVNISSSVPLGLYRFVQIEGPLAAWGPAAPASGRIRARVVLPRFMPLLKPVAGVPGDLVCVQPEGSGSRPMALYQEHRGKPLPSSGAVMWRGRSSGQSEPEPGGRYLCPCRRGRVLWIWR